MLEEELESLRDGHSKLRDELDDLRKAKRFELTRELEAKDVSIWRLEEENRKLWYMLRMVMKDENINKKVLNRNGIEVPIDPFFPPSNNF